MRTGWRACGCQPGTSLQVDDEPGWSDSAGDVHRSLYDCGNGYTGSWSVAGGGSQTIYGIPTGSVCSVTEDALATIDGYTWATPVYTPATITISTKARTFEIVVTNSISKDRDNRPLPNAGTTVPLAGLLAAIGLVSAGLILMGASRFNRRGRKS